MFIVDNQTEFFLEFLILVVEPCLESLVLEAVAGIGTKVLLKECSREPIMFRLTDSMSSSLFSYPTGNLLSLLLCLDERLEEEAANVILSLEEFLLLFFVEALDSYCCLTFLRLRTLYCFGLTGKIELDDFYNG